MTEMTSALERRGRPGWRGWVIAGIVLAFAAGIAVTLATQGPDWDPVAYCRERLLVEVIGRLELRDLEPWFAAIDAACRSRARPRPTAMMAVTGR